jgi:hypothetical protein
MDFLCLLEMLSRRLPNQTKYILRKESGDTNPNWDSKGFLSKERGHN